MGFSDLEGETPESGMPGRLQPPEPPAAAFAAPPSAVEENLPESEQFWEDHDLPDQPPTPVHFEEKNLPEKKGVSPAEQKKIRIPEEKKRKAMKGETEKPVALKERLGSQEIAKKTPAPVQSHLKPFSKTEKKETALSSKERMEKQIKPLSEEQLEEAPSQIEKEEPEFPLAPKEGAKEEKIPFSYSERAIARELMHEEKEREKEKAKGAAMAPVHPPEPLPPACQQIAAAAVASSSPFLNAQTAELYLQMVGTMAFMASSKGGISLTEVTLNSPAFQNSVFFNSTITLEKYATAPDSFNIRLTGTPEAVQVFSNNVENLSIGFCYCL